MFKQLLNFSSASGGLARTPPTVRALSSDMYKITVFPGIKPPAALPTPAAAAATNLQNQPKINREVERFEREHEEVITHTGQMYEKEDFRNVRYLGKVGKQTNPHWAIKLIAEEPPRSAGQQRTVSCDGGGGPLGHPRVFINLDQPGNHSCGYCGLRFYKEAGHH